MLTDNPRRGVLGSQSLATRAVRRDIPKTRVHTMLFLLACVLLVSGTGCLPVDEDSWQHYVNGGHYPSRSPTMSPDGAFIVFSSPQTGHGDIYRIDRDGSGRTRLTTDPAFETSPLFSPDGSTIAFSRESDGRRHIWTIDRDGANQRQLTQGSVLDDPISFSPDGLELLIARSPLSMGMGRTAECLAVQLESKQLRKLRGYTVYSPDGKRVACQFFSESNNRNEIWIADADGTGDRFLVTGTSPCFSPDGGRILYVKDDAFDDPGKLWMMIDADGSNEREFGRVGDAEFANDGEHVLCLSPHWRREVWKMNLDGSICERLPPPAGYAGNLQRCREGFVFKLVTGDRVGDIYVVDTDSWTAKRVASMKE